MLHRKRMIVLVPLPSANTSARYVQPHFLFVPLCFPASVSMTPVAAWLHLLLR